MKKYLRPKNLPVFVLAFSLLGLLLRLWSVGSGPDENALYEPNPLAWALLWIVTLGTAASVVLLTAPLKIPGRYNFNFPASIPGAIGTALAALGIMTSGLSMLTSASDMLSRIAGLLGIVAAVALIPVAFSRFHGQRPNFLLHALSCLFFALRIFIKCKLWSNEPQMGVFLMPFLASVCVMLASYQLASFDVDLGNRRHSLFWSLMGVYFCVAALPASDEPLFYALMAAWLLTNLCSRKPLKPKAQSEPEADPAPQPEPEPEPQPPASAPDMSLDELMDWLDKQ